MPLKRGKTNVTVQHSHVNHSTMDSSEGSQSSSATNSQSKSDKAQLVEKDVTVTGAASSPPVVVVDFNSEERAQQVRDKCNDRLANFKQ